MRKVIEINTGWKMSRSDNADENSFNNSSAEIVFPFCEDSPSAHCILRTAFTLPAEQTDGSMYLCFNGLWGEAELFVDKKKRFVRTSAGGNVSIDVSGYLYSGQQSTLTLLISSYGGCLALSGVRLIIMSKSHFYPLDGTDCGIKLHAEKTGDTVKLHAVQRVINPINYDIASYIVTDSAGRVLGSAASKPSQGDVVIELPQVRLWNGPHDTSSLMLTASILRDSTVLDMVQMSFGIRFPEIRKDGFFCLNGERMPISGMNISMQQAKNVPVKRLIELANELGANAFKLDAIPQNTALIEECDRGGFAVWLDIPSQVTGEAFLSCVRSYASHPSVIFIGTACENTDASETELKNVFRNIIPVNTAQSGYKCIENPVQAVALAPKITPETPVAVCVTENDTDSHEKIWAELCSRAGLAAFFVSGLFSCENGSAPGISGYEPTDEFYFYKSCFSAAPFVKILPCQPLGKYADIKCCSNEVSLSLTVNGKSRKKYTGTLTKGGLVIFGSVLLPLKENIVKVTGEKSSDETEIIVTRKGK